MTKAFCPDCSQKISVDMELYDDGDELQCPKCDADLILVKQGKKVVLKSGNEGFKAFEEEEEAYPADSEETFSDEEGP